MFVCSVGIVYLSAPEIFKQKFNKTCHQFKTIDVNLNKTVTVLISGDKW